jgi:acetoin utilization deacetylase AcuC-like enzyme
LKELEAHPEYPIVEAKVPEPQVGEKFEDLFHKCLYDSHDAGYLKHLETAHEQWVAEKLIKEHESILPECFRLPAQASGSRKFEPPKDIFARTGFYAFDMSSGLCKDSWKSIRTSAFLAYDAVYRVTSNENVDTVVALCRPPGHHCDTKMAGGYCYVNNAVVAVHALRVLRQRSEGTISQRVAILDIDFHHGNGTQDYFYGDPDVLYVSIHAEDEYPYYSGFESEKGVGAGVGSNVNLPLRKDASFHEYKDKLDSAVETLEAFEPEFLVVSLGFDTFYTDPLGSFDIRTADYETIARTIHSNPKLSKIKSVILLEGGYVIEKLGENLDSFLRGWNLADSPGINGIRNANGNIGDRTN